MAKAKKKKSEVDISMMSMVADTESSLERNKVMVESLLYHHYLQNFNGSVNRVYAFISPVLEMKEVGRPEYVEYVKRVKATGKKFAIDFELDLVEKGEEYDL